MTYICKWLVSVAPPVAGNTTADRNARNVTIEDCVFKGGRVNGTGACIGNQWSVVYVRNTTFDDNAATKVG